MPELPEVETVCRSLRSRLLGRRVVDVRVAEPRLREPIDVDRLSSRVRGFRVRAVTRRAKYVRVHLERPRTEASCLVIHLGMSGTLRFADPGEPAASHTHVVFILDDDRELRYRDPRRFGLVDALAETSLDADRRFASLGIEPLSDALTGRWLWERTRGVRAPIKSFLMDAHHIVGVGNIYANEALFLAGVHPKRAAGRIGESRCAAIVEGVRSVLADAIEHGGTTLKDFEGPLGGEGWFRIRLRAYDREGEPCERCQVPIRKVVLGGRSTFFCARCQR